jgi:hypothetical protein
MYRIICFSKLHGVGYEDIVQTALNNGANPKAKLKITMNGCSSALDAAVLNGCEGVVRLILSHGTGKCGLTSVLLFKKESSWSPILAVRKG